MNEIVVVGGGLAGVEAVWQLVRKGFSVKLVEMRPEQMTPAHQTGLLSELVCSNSFRSAALSTAPGLLKAEMRLLDSLVMKWADATQVPAGQALAVDRTLFAQGITDTLAGMESVELVRGELKTIPLGPAIIASGPLTSESLSQAIASYFGEEYLYFYDAIAPIVAADSLDRDRLFPASRYGKGDGGYLNCPMTEEEYRCFVTSLRDADRFTGHDFDQLTHFEGCLPVEEMAVRGIQTLLFGPMKPVGLVDPRTGKQPYAVVQLRAENREETMYNLVGFQTRLRQGEQDRVFRMIPGLAQAEFLRYGAMHRNTYINSPLVLLPTFQSRRDRHIFFAGQITGVEGYIESAASGMIAGINLARVLTGKDPLVFPPETCLGGLSRHVGGASQPFTPMNINFGLLSAMEKRGRKRQVWREAIADRSLEILSIFWEKNRN